MYIIFIIYNKKSFIDINIIISNISKIVMQILHPFHILFLINISQYNLYMRKKLRLYSKTLYKFHKLKLHILLNNIKK